MRWISLHVVSSSRRLSSLLIRNSWGEWSSRRPGEIVELEYALSFLLLPLPLQRPILPEYRSNFTIDHLSPSFKNFRFHGRVSSLHPSFRFEVSSLIRSVSYQDTTLAASNFQPSKRPLPSPIHSPKSSAPEPTSPVSSPAQSTKIPTSVSRGKWPLDYTIRNRPLFKPNTFRRCWGPRKRCQRRNLRLAFT